MNKTILILCLSLFLLVFAKADNSAVTSAVTIEVDALLSGNQACTLQCGNCCTGQSIRDNNSSFSFTIGSSDVDLTPYFDDAQTHWIKGYFYQAKGSCDSGSCSHLHITSIDNLTHASHDNQSNILQIPLVKSDGKNYSVILNGPYTISQASEIVGQSQDCSQGQQCAEGYQCVTYSGIAGNTLKSCEILCIDKQYCPSGKSCLNIADGPQNVCQ